MQQTPTRWTADLETGDPAIDREHRELIELLDRLQEAAAAGDQQAQVSHALDQFRAHTIEHFPHEERAMDAARFPGLARHAAVHARITDLMVELVQKQNNGETVLYSEIEQLGATLYRHILLDDKPFASFLKKR